MKPLRQGREPGSGKLGQHKDFIIERVKATPDITMPELAALLEEEQGACASIRRMSPSCFAEPGSPIKTPCWRRNKGAAT